jgi:hypothetical protein
MRPPFPTQRRGKLVTRPASELLADSVHLTSGEPRQEVVGEPLRCVPPMNLSTTAGGS